MKAIQERIPLIWLKCLRKDAGFTVEQSLAETEAAEVMSLEQAEFEIKARAALVIENIIVIGRILIGVKSSLEHGQFTNWLRDQINFSQSTQNINQWKEVPCISAWRSKKLFFDH